MRAWPLRRSRRRTATLLALVLLGVATAWWMFFARPELPLRRIIERPQELRDKFAEIKGFSPDGSLLVIDHGPPDSMETLIVRHTSTGQIERTFRTVDFDKGRIADRHLQYGQVFFHDFSPDGCLLAVGLHDGNVVKLLHTPAWKEKTTLRQERVRGCRFFPDGKTLLMETIRGFSVWDIVAGQRLATMEEWCQGETTRCWIAPDGRELMAVQLLRPRKVEDHWCWRIGTWDTQTWTLRRESKRPQALQSEFAIDRSGRSLAVVGIGGRIEIQDIQSGQRIAVLQLPVRDVEYGMDRWRANAGSVLFSGRGGVLWAWDIEKPTAMRVPTSLGDSPFCMSDDGRLVATALSRGIGVNGWILRLPSCLRVPAGWCFGKPRDVAPRFQVSVRDLSTGLVLAQTTLGRDSDPCSMAWSPDGSMLAVTDSHGRVLLYDVPQPRK
jgi:WD40 repeat protein